MARRVWCTSCPVVLPAFNEEANIERVVGDCVAFLDTTGLDYELLVVNDGSRDRTGEILTELTTRQPRLRPLHHPQNRGYGAALRTGFDRGNQTLCLLHGWRWPIRHPRAQRLLPLATTMTTSSPATASNAAIRSCAASTPSSSAAGLVRLPAQRAGA